MEPQARGSVVSEEGGGQAQPWDGYVVGPENELGVAAARALARGEPGISPLVIHGGAGVGKTRLLEELSRELIVRKAGASVAVLSWAAFVEMCEEAEVREGGWAELRERLRGLDLFALDDLPAMARHGLAMGELGPMLDGLAERGALVALTARTAPGNWEGWPARLMDRLRAGLSVRLEAPGSVSMRRYVLERVRARGMRVRPEAVDALASAADGYRPVEGRLARLALIARVEGRGIDRELAEQVLADDGALVVGRVSLSELMKAVAKRFGVRVGDLRSADRHRGMVVPRHLAILLARELTGLSFAALGQHFGRRDSKTIRHACEAARGRLISDPALASVAEEIRRELGQRGRG